MVRRGQQKRRDERRASKAVQDLVETIRGGFSPLPRSECTSREFSQTLDDMNTLRIETRLWRRNGRLVDLVAFLDPSGAIDPASADDMTGARRPSAEASVGLFVEYLRARPDGVRLPKSLAADRAPQMVRAKTEPAFT